MKKQSGFTLIELMVVMAIIAILATAGLSAYTGYIKKARDTTRIADLAAINNIILWQVGSTGKPPATAKEVYDAVRTANNDLAIVDPLTTVAATGHFIAGTPAGNYKSNCIGAAVSKECNYAYRICDGGVGYALGARFESSSNATAMYTNDGPDGTVSGSAPESDFTGYEDANIYEVGACLKNCSASACTATSASILPTRLENVAAASAVVLGI